MKRVDLHTHAKISKHLPFDPRSVTRLIRAAERMGLDAIALTEHYDATSYWDI